MILPRVLLADDHCLLLEALEKLLEPHVEIVGLVPDGHELLKSAKKLRPDIIVLDIGMPMLNGLEAGLQIKQKMPDIKLIFLTAHEDPDLAAEALQAGASAYLLKNSLGSELIQAIRKVMKGERFITPSIDSMLMETFIQGIKRNKKIHQLTTRQREVLQLLVEGHSMKTAAQILNVTARTVAFHKYHIMEVLRLKTNAELIQLAMKEGLVSA